MSPTRLIIAEKPSVARDIAKALTSTGVSFTQQPWGFSSPQWWVTSARGHLVAEAAPDAYDPALKKWSMDTLPIIPQPVKHVPRDADAGKLLSVLVNLINHADVDEVVNACDAGREGELIFKLISQYANTTKPIARAWFSSMTTEALTNALGNLRPDSDMIALETAARARAEADWLVGINATRAATVTLGGRELVSLGRVQTPTLALVVARDLEIAQFVSTPYHLVTAQIDYPGDLPVSVPSWHQTKNPDPHATTPWTTTRLDDKPTADAIATRVSGQPVTLLSDDATDESSRPPHLFDLTSLQREANTLFGWSAAKTLAGAQRLYEEFKVSTYPRTDSSFLTTDMASQIPGLLSTLSRHSGEPTATVAASVTAHPEVTARIGKVVNDAKVTDHHAIIPTGTAPPSGMSEEDRRLYTLVCRRFLAALSDPAAYARRVILWQVDSTHDVFRAAGRTLTHEGWTAVYPGPEAKPEKPDAADEREESDETDLPVIPAGVTGVVASARTVSRKTRPPKHFNDSTLLAAMSTAGKLVSDDEWADAMKDNGLGTPATRAATLERLLSLSYLSRSGRNLKATHKGIAVITLLNGHSLTSPEITGKWESALGKIERADAATAQQMAQQFSAAVHKLTTDTVHWFTTVDTSAVTLHDVLGPCPVSACGGRIVERKSSWSCSSWKSKEEPGCGFVIWRKQGGKNLTRAQAKKVLDSSDGVVVPRVAREPVAPCPTPGCGGTIMTSSTGKVYSCDSWKGAKELGCGYLIWVNRKDGTTVSLEMAREMIARGESDRRPPAEKLADCPNPKCKGSVVEKERSFSCDSWSPKKRTNCSFVLWKTAKSGAVLVSRENLAEKLQEWEPRKSR